MATICNWVSLFGTAAVSWASAKGPIDPPSPRTPETHSAPAEGMTMLARVSLSPQGGIGFDDLLYSPALGRIIAPAGNLDALDLIDPATRMVTSLKNSPHAHHSYRGGHDSGITSADTDGAFAFAIDRTMTSLLTLDVKLGNVVSRTRLAASPDYVRYIASTHELWVTEPEHEQIEVFDVRHFPATTPRPARKTTITVAGGPESLVIDQQRDRAYTHLWKGKTVILDTRSHKEVQTFANGCQASRGIALDMERQFVLAGCSEGRVFVLDERQAGKVVGSATTSAGVDIIAYNPELRHLYAPGASDGQMSVLSLDRSGTLHELGRTPTAVGAHCVASDNWGQVWVCEPDQGRILLFRDGYGSFSAR